MTEFAYVVDTVTDASVVVSTPDAAVVTSGVVDAEIVAATGPAGVAVETTLAAVALTHAFPAAPVAGGSTQVFVYDTSVAASGNSYDDWATLIADIADVAGPKTISVTGHETVPAGTWDLNGAGFSGNGLVFGTMNVAGNGAQLDFDDLCYLTNPATVLATNGIALVSLSTDYVMSHTAATDIIIEHNSILMCDSFPMIQLAPTAGTTNVTVDFWGGIIVNFATPNPGAYGNGPVFDVTPTAGSPFIIFHQGINGSYFSSEVIQGTTNLNGGFGVLALLMETMFINPFFAIDGAHLQTICNGGLTGGEIGGVFGQQGWDAVVRATLASKVRFDSSSLLTTGDIQTALNEFANNAHLAGYIPTTPGDWNVPPVTVGEALDQIAAALGPI